MNRAQVIKEIQKYFNAKELVCDHTYAKWGEKSWDFLDTNALETLLVLRRDIICLPMVINYQGHYQRGLRCNMCELVKSKQSVYLSQHIFGKAFDVTVNGMTAEEARQKISANASRLPYPIRIEADVTWLHFDTNNYSSQKIQYFKG